MKRRVLNLVVMIAILVSAAPAFAQSGGQDRSDATPIRTYVESEGARLTQGIQPVRQPRVTWVKRNPALAGAITGVIAGAALGAVLGNAAERGDLTRQFAIVGLGIGTTAGFVASVLVK